MSNEHNRVQNRPLNAELSISAAEWEAGIGALRKYVLVRGSAPISRSARANGFAVGAWAEAGHFGSGAIDAQCLAANLVGAVVKDPVQDKVVMQEYLETVVRERKGWGDLYAAIHEVM